MSSALTRRPLGASVVRRLLDDPALLPQLRALPAPALRQLILHVGLEDSGELIALASLEQLRAVFDEDLWRSPRPGADEDFDAVRFALWLEVLLEAGEAFVAERLAALSEDFLAHAFAQVVRVYDTAEVQALVAAEDERFLDDLLDTQLCQELDEYLVVSRFERGWDAVWTSLQALDERHGDLLRVVLRRSWLASRSEAETAGGFSTALREDQTLREDARSEREERRAAHGHVSPADARAFLALARTPTAETTADPITRAYFRELRRTAEPSASRRAAREPTPLRRLVERIDVAAAPSAALAPTTRPLFEAMARLGESDAEAHARVVEELAYLANVLVAGDASRTWRAADAAEEVLRLCEIGLRAKLASQPAGAVGAHEALGRWGAVGLFRVAWAGSVDAEGTVESLRER